MKGGNNLVSYNWNEFGPGEYFGQECMLWCYPPDVSHLKMNKATEKEGVWE